MSLTVKRRADRQAMALRVASLAGEYGLAAERKPEQPGTRQTSVDLAGPHGLKLTVRFAGNGPDVYVLSWHGVEEGTRLHWGMFNNVNSFHGHKATDVAHGFDQLERTLRDRFTVIRNGSAFVTEPVSVPRDLLDDGFGRSGVAVTTLSHPSADTAERQGT